MLFPKEQQKCSRGIATCNRFLKCNSAILAQEQLANEEISVDVISFPSWNLFEKQSQEYKRSILLPDVKIRLAIEMGSSLGWERYVGDQGDVLAIDRFGASAPEEIILGEYGFTVQNVVGKLKELLKAEK